MWLLIIYLHAVFCFTVLVVFLFPAWLQELAGMQRLAPSKWKNKKETHQNPLASWSCWDRLSKFHSFLNKCVKAMCPLCETCHFNSPLRPLISEIAPCVPALQLGLWRSWEGKVSWLWFIFELQHQSRETSSQQKKELSHMESIISRRSRETMTFILY